jgi:hypothetical protein
MATERRRQAILVVLVLALGALLYRLWPGTSASSAPASNPSVAATTAAPASQPAASAAPAGRGTTGQRGSAGQRGAPGQSALKAPDVHLDSLEAEWPKPEGAQRNLFRFKPKAPPPPPPPPPPGPVVTAPPPGPPPPVGPPPVPPITLKFIGIIDAPESGKKIAVLSDGKNPPFQGIEGQIVEGRYRIIKIGVESVEIAYADGRGRQTIRLTGS